MSVFSSVPTTFAGKLAAILELHLHAVRVFHDVEIGVDEPVLPNDKARAFALHRLRHAATLTRIVVVRRLKEQIVQRGVVPVGLFCHLDDDHTRRHDLEDLGESAVQLMNNIFPGRGGLDGNRRCGLRHRHGRRGRNGRGIRLVRSGP